MSDPNPGPVSPDTGAEAEPSSPGEPKPTPVRVEKPPAEQDEMGGEAPCQLHRFWDVEE